jgi:hypothetical protein
MIIIFEGLPQQRSSSFKRFDTCYYSRSGLRFSYCGACSLSVKESITSPPANLSQKGLKPLMQDSDKKSSKPGRPVL